MRHFRFIGRHLEFVLEMCSIVGFTDPLSWDHDASLKLLEFVIYDMLFLSLFEQNVSVVLYRNHTTTLSPIRSNEFQVITKQQLTGLMGEPTPPLIQGSRAKVSSIKLSDCFTIEHYDPKSARTHQLCLQVCHTVAATTDRIQTAVIRTLSALLLSDTVQAVHWLAAAR